MPFGYRGATQHDAADSGKKARLTPRSVEVVDVEEHAAERDREQEQKLAELRSRALAALNLRLPPSRDAEPVAASSSSRCTCLRRSGRCTCNEDRAWLQSKRKEVSMYQPPHMRQASGEASSSGSRAVVARKRTAGSDGDEEDDGSALCTCLRRSGRCTCGQDAAWLQRKRRPVVPYVPPHVKSPRDVPSSPRHPHHVDTQNVEEGAKSVDVAAEKTPEKEGQNSRQLAKEWDSRLDQLGEGGFNPLQMDGQIVISKEVGQIVIEDSDGLVAECMDHPLSAKGVKGLPAIQSGRYQYEVELLRDSSMMVGWSGAMTLPGVLDFQGYTYSSSGCKWHGQEETSYAKPYGKAGDIIGALIDWIEPDTASGTRSINLSFCLNGESLGSAFTVGANLLDAKKGAPVPLQPHICQLPRGDMLKVRLRGSKAQLPLAHPVEGYQPLSAVSDVDFCPFSVAIEAATSERVIMNLTPEDLQSFRLPENHIVELYDFPSDASGDTLTSSVACFLGLKRYLGVLHIRMTEAGSSTAVAACRRPEHAEALIEASRADDFGVADCIDIESKRTKPLPFEARPLSSATATTQQRLLAWRGE